MMFLITIIVLLNCISAFEPPCTSCKYFVPNVKIFDDLGLCKIFKDVNISKGKQYTLYNYAVHCRENENLCGKSGILYEPIVKEPIIKNATNKSKINVLSDKYFEEIRDSEQLETEQLERDIFDVLQKIKKHNKKKIYNTTKDLYKLFRRDNKF
jgi:hypothetical protein